jgi:hypothetical protein
MRKIYQWEWNGVELKTGDLICTEVGDLKSIDGGLSIFIGMIIPGPHDHIAIYTGPDGRFIEACPNGVIEACMDNSKWDAKKLFSSRGFIDHLAGAVYPLSGNNGAVGDETTIRLGIANYCQSQVGKKYNFNFLDPETEDVFYCSQLAYRAYMTVSQKNINLHCGMKHAYRNLWLPPEIVYPQEIWDGFTHKSV